MIDHGQLLENRIVKKEKNSLITTETNIIIRLFNKIVKKYRFYLNFLFIVFIFKCSSVPEFHYYFLNYDMPRKENTNPKYPYILGIEEFDSDEIYNNDSIVYRDSPYEIKHYIYKKWAGNPRNLISEKALEHFIASGLFKVVRFYPNFHRIDYLLRGNIKSFEEWDKQDGWYSKFSLEIEFINVHNDSILFVLRTDKVEKAVSKSVIDVVKSMSVCVKETFDEIISKIDNSLSEL